MSRDLGDLTPEEWAQAGKLFKLATAGTDKEITDETLFVRSHVWPNAVDDSCDWLVFVPGTVHRARGTAESTAMAMKAINDQVMSWYPELTNPDGPDAWGFVQRIVP